MSNPQPELTSGVSTSPADPLLRDAIDKALEAAPRDRAPLFETLLREIESFMGQHPQERPWTYTTYTGTDGSTIFRGGTGRSIVIAPDGIMWRGRSLEDFDTTYDITETSCSIASLTPKYEQMQQCTRS